MLNLSQVSKYYSQQKNGKCKFVQKYGPKMGMTCSNITDSLFCDEHMRYGADEDKAVNFLQTLTTDPSMLNELLEIALFFKTHHSVEDCERGECENCYSDDIEFDFKEKLYNVVSSFYFPNLRAMPSIPNSPMNPSIPNSPTNPSIPNSPTNPSIPNSPMMPSINLPTNPSIPTLPMMPSIPNSPMIPSIDLPMIPSIDLPMIPSIDLPMIPSIDLPMMPSIPTVYPTELNVVQFGNYFRDINYGFVLKQEMNGAVTLLLDETEKSLKRKLTDIELKCALSMGISY